MKPCSFFMPFLKCYLEEYNKEGFCIMYYSILVMFYL